MFRFALGLSGHHLDQLLTAGLAVEIKQLLLLRIIVEADGSRAGTECYRHLQRLTMCGLRP